MLLYTSIFIRISVSFLFHFIINAMENQLIIIYIDFHVLKSEREDRKSVDLIFNKIGNEIYSLSESFNNILMYTSGW